MPITDDILKKLRCEVLDNVLKPGEPLSEHVLAKRFNSSRTPVREAIKKLESEHLVQIVPGRGSFVSTVDISHVSSIYEVRVALEPIAARTSFKFLRPNELAELETQWLNLKERAGDQNHYIWEEIAVLDRKTHHVFTKKTPNQWLRTFLSIIDVHVARMQNLAVFGLGEKKESIRQHLELINIAQSGDMEHFIATLTNHIIISEEYVRANIELF